MNILADFRTQRPATLADAVSALAAEGAVPLAAGGTAKLTTPKGRRVQPVALTPPTDTATLEATGRVIRRTGASIPAP